MGRDVAHLLAAEGQVVVAEPMSTMRWPRSYAGGCDGRGSDITNADDVAAPSRGIARSAFHRSARRSSPSPATSPTSPSSSTTSTRSGTTR
jgi:hypothetical protein